MQREDRAEDVVGGADVGDPVTQRLVDRILERATAGGDRDDFRAEQLHAKDVELLPRHVHFAHVNDALQAEERAGGGGGHAVLSGAGLGDDALLLHPLGDQRLADGVVDLVRASVIEILALQKEAKASAEFCELRSVSERSRTANVIRQDVVELAAKCAVASDFSIRGVELVERRHQRLGNVSATEFAKVAVAIGKPSHPRLTRSKSRTTFW